MNAPAFKTWDGLQNLVSNLNTSKDKSFFNRYVYRAITKPELDSAYRNDWIAAKVIDIPAKDSTRAWRNWQADQKQIELLEETEKEHAVQQKLKRALIRSRLYGGAAIVLGVDGAGNPEQELVLDRVKQGALKFVHVFSRYEISHGQMIDDIMSPFYGQPEYYELQGNVTLGADNGSKFVRRIHPSRVVRLTGREVPDLTIAEDRIWGDSILQSVYDATSNASAVSAAIASLTHEAKIDIIKVPNLSENLVTDAYTQRMSTRFSYANTMKSLNNMFLMDAEEEYEQKTISFATLPDILKLYLLMAGGAADIPETRMLGQSPRGLSGKGEADARNYYDHINSEQKTELSPALHVLDEVLIRSALGARDPGIFYEWNSLWQLTEAEQADLSSKKAATFKIDHDAGLIPPEVMREARKNQLIEDGTYPGMQQVFDDYDAGKLKPVGPSPQEIAQQQQQAAQTAQQQAHEVAITKIKVGARVPANVASVPAKDYSPDQPRDPAGRWSSGGVVDPLNPAGYVKQKEVFSPGEYQAFLSYVRHSDGMNAWLRGEGRWSSAHVEVIKHLDAALEKSKLAKDVVVYRGLTNQVVHDNAESLIGKELPINNYQSTSLDREQVSNTFAQPTGRHSGPLGHLLGLTPQSRDEVIMEISAKKGTKAIDMYQFSDFTGHGEEKELLFHRHGHYKVNSVHRDEHNRPIIRAELVQ